MQEQCAQFDYNKTTDWFTYNGLASNQYHYIHSFHYHDLFEINLKNVNESLSNYILKIRDTKSHHNLHVVLLHTITRHIYPSSSSISLN